MKKLYKAALLAALGLASVTAAQASTDLLLGFNDAGSTNSAANNDYVVDLGALSQFTTTATIDLSSAFNATTFAAAFGADLGGSSYGNYNNVAAGAAGGSSGGSVFGTGGATGSSSATAFNYQVNAVGGVVIGEYGSASLNSWSSGIAAGPSGFTPGLFVAAGGAPNPMFNLSGGTITEILYQSVYSGSGKSATATGFTEVGTLAIDVNTGSVIFTGVAAVPEPSTYALFGGAGLMLLVFRNKFRRIQA